MPELRGLTGVKGALPVQHVVSVEQAVRRIRHRRAVTCAGPAGAINVWRDDTKQLRSCFCRYRAVINEVTHSDAESLRAWLDIWWPSLEREVRPPATTTP